jgi:hypothetical protein
MHQLVLIVVAPTFGSPQLVHYDRHLLFPGIRDKWHATGKENDAETLGRVPD